MCRKLQATSFEVNGLPLWNLTPGRSWKVHVLASGVACQATANRGLSAQLPGTMYVRRSYVLLSAGCETAMPVCTVGSLVSAADVSV